MVVSVNGNVDTFIASHAIVGIFPSSIKSNPHRGLGRPFNFTRVVFLLALLATNIYIHVSEVNRCNSRSQTVFAANRLLELCAVGIPEEKYINCIVYSALCDDDLVLPAISQHFMECILISFSRTSRCVDTIFM